MYINQVQFVEQAGKPGPLFRQKSGVFLIRLPILKVNFSVRDVPVATEQDFLTIFFSRIDQSFEFWIEAVEETKFGLLPLLGARPGRQVEGDY